MHGVKLAPRTMFKWNSDLAIYLELVERTHNLDFVLEGIESKRAKSLASHPRSQTRCDHQSAVGAVAVFTLIHPDKI